MTNTQRLTEEVKLRCFEDKFISRDEENEIIQVAISIGITVDEARSLIKGACYTNEYVLEREIDEKATEMLTQFAQNDGKIDKKEFDDTFGVIKSASKGRISDVNIKKKLKEIVLENQLAVKEGLLKGGSWFSSI